jgi:hypothetical protein
MKIDRKQFLQLFAAASVAPPVRAWPQQASPSADTEGSQQFALRVAEDGAAALRCALCYIGDRLDIFKAMASSGPVSAAQLARKTGLNGRMLREWLNAMAAARYIDYRPGDKT